MSRITENVKIVYIKHNETIKYKKIKYKNNIKKL